MRIDRVLGIVCALLVLFCAYVVLTNFSFSWAWFMMLVFTIGLGVWARSGLKNTEVGWKRILLFLGGRMNVLIDEGLAWLPWPFDGKPIDCRETAIGLDPLTVITKDNVQVDVDVTIFRKIVDLNLFLDVEEKTVRKGLDDTTDHIVRTEVVDLPLDGVIKIHEQLAKKVHQALEEQAVNWGVDITKVVIAAIKPDPKIIGDLSLKKHEELQREGQRVEVAHFATMVDLLVNGGTIDGKIIPGGQTREQAIENIQLALGRATKTIDAKVISLDAATTKVVDAVATKVVDAFLGRRG
jgi:hypothetical protein